MKHPARYGWPAFLVAAGVAIGSFLLRGYFQPEADVPEASVLSQMDFEASGLTVIRYDEQGTPGFELTAPRAERFRAEDALALLQADFRLADRDAQGAWLGRADRVEVSTDAAPLQMTGEVKLARENENLTLRAPTVWLDPQARRAWGEDTVVLERTGSVVNAQQFEADLEQSAVQLSGRVSGSFRPKTR
ncbi:MAG: LPS export ABC transporter periplasmic protein LptC [Xanthomonadales bacterium]|nr:LPS export ABC transporter periplasmic protein LptC [Xanthomonadales bacterium]MCB1633923.1 LPS export ABC transporter periplasmic protein LptC [Xanthomonadales bacterium]